MAARPAAGSSAAYGPPSDVHPVLAVVVRVLAVDPVAAPSARLFLLELEAVAIDAPAEPARSCPAGTLGGTSTALFAASIP